MSAKVKTAAAAAASTEQADKAEPVEPADKAEQVEPADKAEPAATVKLRAVHGLGVRHPDRNHGDGRPVIFTRFEAVSVPASAVDPESPERDPFLLTMLEAGYLEKAGQ